MKQKSIPYAVLLLFITTVSLYGREYGATEIDPFAIFLQDGCSPAVITQGIPHYKPETQNYICPWSRYYDDWYLLCEDTITTIIPTGQSLVISFDPSTETLNIENTVFPLSPVQDSAIARAPLWLKADLYDNFRRFEFSMTADWVAQLIIDAPDPYVDEIAFQAAHLPPTMLGNYMYSDMLMQNAELLYEMDQSLNFVEIIDVGTSADNDYYSTTRYTTIDDAGQVQTITIDKEIYYWYVAHPKLSDELPTYIDPATGTPADPPTGVFWRDYLWNHADSGYVLFSTVWDSVDYLWNRGAPGYTDAIGTVNSWIDNVMNWGAGSERPIQPVRIYTLHCGNCGEYQDIRNAAARIALIPSVSTSNICEDHVWNEFWAVDTEEWIHWDGGSINSPLMYEQGWGKILSAVFNWRGDGYVWNVTDRYSADVCTLTVQLWDSTGKPADGYRIKVYSDFYYGGVYYTTWGITNAQGYDTFILGDNKNYYVRVEGVFGNFPPTANAYTNVIQTSQPGASYYWEHTMTGASMDLNVTQAVEYPNPLDDYMMQIGYNCIYDSDYGTFFTNSNFARKTYPGNVDFFLANQENYAQYFIFQPAQGFAVSNNSAGGLVDFVLPTDEAWYGVFSNREQSVVVPTISVTASVYSSSSEAGLPGNNLPLEFSMNDPYPNPFNSEIIISFSAANLENITIIAYNVLGQEIAVLTDAPYAPGSYSVKWDGRDAFDGTTSSGVYIISMQAGLKHFSQKCCLIK